MYSLCLPFKESNSIISLFCSKINVLSITSHDFIFLELLFIFVVGGNDNFSECVIAGCSVLQ